MGKLRKVIGFLVCSMLLIPTAMAEMPLNEGDGDRELRIGLWRPFFEGMNFSDAKEATQVWVESWGRNDNLCSSARVIFFDDMKRFTDSLTRHELDFALMETRQFLAIEDRNLVEPTFTTRRGGRIGDEYVLLVHRDSGIKSVEDLAGLEINLPHSGYYDIARTWLDTVLAEHGLPPTDQFFGMVNSLGKPSQIVLPLFFGQVDACLVARSDFEIMGELNPQVKARIHELCQSPRFVSLVFCSSPHLETDFMTRITESILNLDLDSHTQQILTLHRMDSIELLKPGDLGTIRELTESDR